MKNKNKKVENILKYIHYGHSEFDMTKFNKIKNIPEFAKADGGLWASRVDAEYSWKDWCESSGFDADFSTHFEFRLNEDARILVIDKSEKLKELPKAKSIFEHPTFILLDFEELSKQYDAIEVLITKDGQLYWDLYGWDCDSIFIMNPDVIIQEK